MSKTTASLYFLGKRKIVSGSPQQINVKLRAPVIKRQVINMSGLVKYSLCWQYETIRISFR